MGPVERWKYKAGQLRGGFESFVGKGQDKTPADSTLQTIAQGDTVKSQATAEPQRQLESSESIKSILRVLHEKIDILAGTSLMIYVANNAAVLPEMRTEEATSAVSLPTTAIIIVPDTYYRRMRRESAKTTRHLLDRHFNVLPRHAAVFEPTTSDIQEGLSLSDIWNARIQNEVLTENTISFYEPKHGNSKRDYHAVGIRPHDDLAIYLANYGTIKAQKTESLIFLERVNALQYAVSRTGSPTSSHDGAMYLKNT